MNTEITLLNFTQCDLINLAKAGDASAFSALFDLHKSRIYSVCLRLAGSPAAAEELTQNAFLRVFRQLEDFCEDTDFATSVYRAALEVAVAQRRATRVGTDRELSIDHLVRLASESVCPRRRAVRFSGVRAKIAQLNLPNTSWSSVASTFGRARRSAKAIS